MNVRKLSLNVLMVLIAATLGEAGRIEDLPDGTTVFHVGVFALPDPWI